MALSEYRRNDRKVKWALSVATEDVGKGCAAALKGMGAQVMITRLILFVLCKQQWERALSSING